ncbi:MAG TPA: sigma-70 family RNA polymerase sigma factor [Thermoanaerobaculia bacterium]|nr:sigma-70 family RNA polymerase sigma factor [Thermoanaerobaculia bacterium]
MTLTQAPIEPAAAAPGEAAAPRSDAELVLAARRGSAAAADELARRCRQPAYLLALQLLRDPDDALDVAQDALLRFFTHLDRVRPEDGVKPWLHAIVRNRSRDLLRRRRVRRIVRSLESDRPEDRIDPVDTAPGPHAGVERRELQERIWRALGELTEAQREILVLRDYQDLTYDEIATLLRIPLGTVMSRLHRARRALEERLAAAGEVPHA